MPRLAAALVLAGLATAMLAKAAARRPAAAAAPAPRIRVGEISLPDWFLLYAPSPSEHLH